MQVWEFSKYVSILLARYFKADIHKTEVAVEEFSFHKCTVVVNSLWYFICVF